MFNSSNDKFSKKDLRISDPFNSYRHKELPPYAICNPSAQAVKSVLHPTSTRALYFVANGLGGHAFAENLRQHRLNVKKWRQFQHSLQP